MPRKPYRSAVTDAQWERIKRLVPKPTPTGRPREDEREVFNGILYVLWEDLPHDIGVSPKTCNRRLLEYQRRRVWQRMVADWLTEANRRGSLNLKTCYHDASVVKSKKGRTRKSATRASTGLKG